jgi:hypothetical protein
VGRNSWILGPKSCAKNCDRVSDRIKSGYFDCVKCALISDSGSIWEWSGIVPGKWRETTRKPSPATFTVLCLVILPAGLCEHSD